MDAKEFELLRLRVIEGSLLRDSYLHGERHWRAVAVTGLELLPSTPDADPETVLLFALFHDARRVNEVRDPDHGLRGANLAREFGIGSDVLYRACRDHTGGDPTAEPTIGVCFDADRLNLGRVGIPPEAEYLSTAGAPGLIDRAGTFHASAPEWPELVRRYEALGLKP